MLRRGKFARGGWRHRNGPLHRTRPRFGTGLRTWSINALEIEPERQLHLTVRADAHRRADRVRRPPEGARRGRGVGLTGLDLPGLREGRARQCVRQGATDARKVRVVEHVEHFHPELAVRAALNEAKFSTSRTASDGIDRINSISFASFG